jgi:hypothetical protein
MAMRESSTCLPSRVRICTVAEFALPLRKPVDEHGDLAPHVRFVTHRLHRWAFGDPDRFVICLRSRDRRQPFASAALVPKVL